MTTNKKESCCEGQGQIEKARDAAVEKRASEPSPEAKQATELEIAANYMRGQHKCDAPLGYFVQQAIDKALEQRETETGRG